MLRLSALLSAISKEELEPNRGRLVIVLDGLDELDVRNRLSTILPSSLPPGVRLLVSSRPDYPRLSELDSGGVAAVLGHVFPIFYGFRGGKGVATAVGAFLVLAPLALLSSLAVFVVVVALTKYVSLGSVISMVLLPPIAGLLFHAPPPVVRAAAVIALLVVLKHLGNLKRLARGEERKIGAK